MRTPKNIRFIPKGQEYRYTGSNEVSFAGNFAHNGAKGSDYTFFFLDEFDQKYTKNVKLKANEQIYRVETDRSKRAGIRQLIKINSVNGMVYFLDPERADEEAIQFEARGTVTRYMNLVTV